MLIKSEDEDVQKRYVVKENDAGEYQVYDTFYKIFVGDPSRDFEQASRDCKNLNDGWKKLAEGHDF